MDCDPDSLMQAAKCYRCIPPGMLGAVQVDLLCRWANNQETPVECTDPIVIDWLARINAGLGPAFRPSDPTIQAVCDFCTALRVAGIENRFLAINPIIPDSIEAMAYPLYTSGVQYGFSPWTNFGPFITADLNNQGLLGQGAGSVTYFDTGIDPSVEYLGNEGSASLTLCESEPFIIPLFPEETIGLYDSKDSGNAFLLDTYEPAGIADLQGICWDALAGTGIILGGLLNDTPAIYCMNRETIDNLQVWQQNSTTPLNSLNTDLNDQSGVPLPGGGTVFFMCMNDPATGPFNETDKRISFAAIGFGLNQSIGTEIADFFNAIIALRAALGGGYP